MTRPLSRSTLAAWRRPARGNAQVRLILVVAVVAILAWYLYANRPDSLEQQTGLGSGDGIAAISREAMGSSPLPGLEDPAATSDGVGVALPGTASTGESAGDEPGSPLPGEAGLPASGSEGSADVDGAEVAALDVGKGTGSMTGPDAAGPDTGVADTSEMRDGEWARMIISGIRDGAGDQSELDKVYENAQGFAEKGRFVDSYLLHFFAARQGYGPSAFVLGTVSDPKYFSQDMALVDGPDELQALKWYGVAAKQGVAEAEQRLRDLRASVESEAATGSADAQRLLLQWK